MAKKKSTKRITSEQSGDAVDGRRIDGAPYDATEPERIRDLERSQAAPPDDEFVTDAELEAREMEWPSDED